jgi:hypothetical protein
MEKAGWLADFNRVELQRLYVQYLGKIKTRKLTSHESKMICISYFINHAAGSSDFYFSHLPCFFHSRMIHIFDINKKPKPLPK